MGKNKNKNKIYAVRAGRGAPMICNSWPECEKAVSGYYGARHKSFATMKAAQSWLDEGVLVPLASDSSIVPATTGDTSSIPPLTTADAPTFSMPAVLSTSSSGTLPSTLLSGDSQWANLKRLHTLLHGMDAEPPLRKRRKLDDEPLQDSTSVQTNSSNNTTEDQKPRRSKKCRVEPEAIVEAQTIISQLLGIDSAADAGTEICVDPVPKVEDTENELEECKPDIMIEEKLPVLMCPPPPAPTAPEVELSEEQQHVLHLVKSGSNVFFTGSAGTGKSVLLKAIVSHFQLAYPDDHDVVAITSTTGISGVNIGGSTIHSWAGVGLGKESVETLIDKVGGSRFYKRRWTRARLLMIDEISMMDGDLFDKLESIGRYVRRRHDKPFGGLQLVLSGDFFQLPPVPDTDSFMRKVYKPFAFDSKCWQECIGKPVLLTHVFRQGDAEFVSMLNRIKTAQLDAATIAKFKQLARQVVYTDGIEASLLFPTKLEVERYNTSKLKELSGDLQVYHAVDSRGWDVYGERVPVENARRLLDQQMVPSYLELKTGAQVMLIRNVVQGKLVNGSLGIVEEFLTLSEAAGKTIEIASTKKDDDNPRHLRVSHLRSTERLYASMPQKSSDGRIYETNERFPVVRFENGMRLLCSPIDFDVEGLRGNIEARRVQVPLILAWALSIHKSQGQTLSRVKVDLKRIFENGQAYVALSRARDMENLEVLNFDPGRIKVHARVVAWTKSWMSPEQIQQHYYDS